MRPFARSRFPTAARSASTSRARSGFALVVVLLVLLALLVLATPLVISARGADKAASQLADRAEARIALDAAARHARLVLADTYPSVDLDRTPYFDSPDELAVSTRFAEGFLDPNDPNATMWGVDVTDEAGLVDLNSASPHVLANLMGLATRFTAVVQPDAKTLPLASASALEPTGFVECEGELVRYTKIQGSDLVQFDRGVLGPSKPEDWRGGPMPPTSHGIGAPVLDQRAFAPCLWRLVGTEGDLHPFESIEALADAGAFAHAAALDARGTAILTEAVLAPVFASCSAHAGVRGGARWQRAARLVGKVQGGKDGVLRVDDAHWFAPGSTVRVRDGKTAELAIVSRVDKGGGIALDRILKEDYDAQHAVVEVLARRPVDLNSARQPVLEALFLNLQVAGRNSRVTSDEARTLAEVVIASRPLTGFEDFLRRVLLPAAGIEKYPADAPPAPPQLASAFLDPLDAVAVFANGLNANDVQLAWSTMPYAFTTRDVYGLELRASVDAQSGIQRAAKVREDVVCVAPQSEITRVWSRQEDYDEELRLSLDAPRWLSGPNATSRYDGGSTPPSRLWAELGTFEGKTYLPGVTDESAMTDRQSPPIPEHVFPSREDQGFVQLMPVRAIETQPLQGRMLHFDHETRDLEGRYLPDQVVSLATDDKMVGWTRPDAPLCRPLALSFWVRTRAIADGRLLDVAGTSGDVDRVTLGLEGADLVLRVIDGFGDHRLTTEKEWGEVRYALASGNVPGLPNETWNHVELDVRGDRPSQMHVLVNGLAQGVRTMGLTRLASAVAQNATQIAVESTEGFPARCAVRIGNEILEVHASNGLLDATPATSGAEAGFGGRMARERSLSEEDASSGPPASIAQLAVQHPAGTPVELYGYSVPLESDVPAGMSELASELGRFRVCVVKRVINGQTPAGDLVEASGYVIGTGMRGVNSSVTGLTLGLADDGMGSTTPTDSTEFMNTFDPAGGYAAVVQAYGRVGNSPVDVNQSPVGGVEIIRYSGWNNATLNIVQRGIDATTLPNLGGVATQIAPYIGGKRSFVNVWSTIPGVPDLNKRMNRRIFVVPISLGVPNTSDTRGFLAAKAGRSNFAQLTHTSDAENTEWVRYDWFDTRFLQLVRDDPTALFVMYQRLTQRDLDVPLPPAGGGPGGGGGGGPGTGGGAMEMLALEPAAAQTSTSGGSAWDPRLGKLENLRASAPITRCIETYFQFRGVLGTYSHHHPAGTKVLPVFRVGAHGFDGGKPGRLDPVFLVGAQPSHPGWPVRVHRAHVPAVQRVAWDWSQTQENGPVQSTDSRDGHLPTDGYLAQSCFVAFDDRAPENVLAESATPGVATADARLFARLVCYPSGERPRAVTKLAIGGSVPNVSSSASSATAVPSAVVDEIAFGDASFGRATPGIEPDSLAGASLVLAQDVDDTALELYVQPKAIRVAMGPVGTTHEFLADLQQDGGLLRIGEEIVAYKRLDSQTGRIELAASGRGRLGTRPQPHQTYEPILYLEHRRASVLTDAIGAGDGELSIASIEHFPREGLVLIGDELVRYTRISGTALQMPRASSVPGALDAKGDGLFRGRYGTAMVGHGAGEAVILFPERYPDMWARRADAPELAYFGFTIDQPAAFFGSVFFKKSEMDGARLGLLQRSSPDVPWDADPDKEPRISILWQGEENGKPVQIGRQSDRCDWRAFVEYQKGAFDPKTGLAHGWRRTPRLELVAATYHAPSVTLRSVER